MSSKHMPLQDQLSQSNHSDLGQNKTFAIYGQSLDIFSDGQTNNCLIEILLRGLNQSLTHSAAPTLPQQTIFLITLGNLQHQNYVY